MIKMKEKGKILISEILESTLEENDISIDPVSLAEVWYREAIEADVIEPTAVSLATSGIDNKPSVRFVLLKKISEKGFVFFTNFMSRKASQIEANKNAAIAIYWPQLTRQIRIEGVIEKLSDDESDEYYDSRPEGSRIGAWASPQSRIIPGRAYLDNLKYDFDNAMAGKVIGRPSFWGGYILIPDRIEFWKAREDRLHDRIEFVFENDIWQMRRLAP